MNWHAAKDEWICCGMQGMQVGIIRRIINTAEALVKG